ncbi:TetR family transcriptional regulator [Streptomyces sp. NBC_01613]|uniref:TetR/AcrR family transcriptional regulator n=1 Tax=Streptomyces sp. NBC_01613 TaxID=2975896 RepID=UPI00386E5F6C
MTEKAQRSRGSQTRAAILAAARARFAADGYEKATIRAIAADAHIDPSMVMRYYGNKEQLFAAAVDIDLELPDLAAVPADELPQVVVRHFLQRWEGDAADDALLLLLRSAVTNQKAAEHMRSIFMKQVSPAFGKALDDREAAERAALVSCQLLGLALGRYLLAIPAVTSQPVDTLVDRYAPAILAVLER